MADVGDGLPADKPLQDEGGASAADEEAELAKLEAELYGNDGNGDGVSEDPGSGGAQGDDNDGEGGAPVPMSKKQMKKKAKMERMLAKREEQRQREKAARAQRRAEANQRKAAELADMSEEQKVELRREKQARLEAHKEAERQLRERMKQSLESGPRIVIDLDWESRMTENDMRHLVQQLSFSYAANKAVERPAHMVMTSFKRGVAALAKKMISGLENWYVTRTEQHYGELFSSPEDRGRLVYLTADAEEELDDLDEQKIYIIGGLVDHNRYKGLCEETARAAGIATARLPINRHVQLASRAVLTVNHVFQLLVEYYARRDWTSALDVVLPRRKRADAAKQPQDRGQQQRQQQGQGARKDNPPAPPQQHQAKQGGDAIRAAAEVEVVSAAADADAAGNAATAEPMEGAVMPTAGAGEAGKENSLEAAKAGEEERAAGKGTKRKAEDEPSAVG